MKTLITTVLLSLTLLISGCANLSLGEDRLQLPVTYGTLKVIERDNDIDAEEIITVISKLESFVNSQIEVNASDIRSYVVTLNEWEDLPASDKFLVSAIFQSVEDTVKNSIERDALLPSEIQGRISQLLGYVRTAAILSQ